MKKSVFKETINTKIWMKAAGIRAVKTMAQSLIAVIGAFLSFEISTASIGTVDWKVAISTSCLAAVLSILTSISGLPEVEEHGEEKEEV